MTPTRSRNFSFWMLSALTFGSLAAPVAWSKEDCGGLAGKIQGKLEDKGLDVIDKYAKKNGLPGLVKPIGGYYRDLAHAKNDQDRRNAAIDEYFDGALGKIPGFIKNPFRDRAKNAFAEFTGGKDSGGCGGDGADDAARGSGGAGRRIDPLVLDMTGKGVRFIDVQKSHAYFDLTGNGFATRTAWVEPNVAFLALDRNHDGVVNDISELFGSAQQDGFTELRAFDRNHDGKLDREEIEKSQLLLWTDRNSDAVSQPSELTAATLLGISEISLQAKSLTRTESDGRVLSQSTFVRGGAVGDIYDIDFLTLPAFSRYIGSLDASTPAVVAHQQRLVTEDDLQGINLRGYGVLTDLAVAMQQKPTLRAQVEALRVENDPIRIRDGFEALLFAWADIGDVQLSDLDRTPLLSVDKTTGEVHFARAKVHLSLKRLAFVKKYAGLDRLAMGDGVWREGTRTRYTGSLYADAWASAYGNLLAKFVVRAGMLDQARYPLRYRVDSDYLYSSIPFDSSALSGAVMLDIFSSEPARRTQGFLAQLVLSEMSGTSKRAFAAQLGRVLARRPAEAQGAELSNALLPLIVDVRVAGKTEALEGGLKDSILLANANGSTLKAGSGKDVLVGGMGNDLLFAGPASTTFVLQNFGGIDTVSNSCRQTVRDRVIISSSTVLDYDGDDLWIVEPSSRARLVFKNCFAYGSDVSNLDLELENGDVVPYDTFLKALPPVFASISNTRLFTAIDNHSTPKVTLLVAGRVDVNAVDSGNRRPLQAAVSNGSLAIVDLLLSRPDLDFNASSPDGRTALHIAAMGSKVAVLERLLSVPGLDVNKTDSAGRTALHFAASRGDAARVERLLNALDINVNAQNHSGETALHLAAASGDVDTVTRLAGARGIRFNIRNNNGATAFQVAPEKVKKVMAFLGADPSTFAVRLGRAVVAVHHWLENYAKANSR